MGGGEGVMVTILWWWLHAGTGDSKETAKALGGTLRQDSLQEQLVPRVSSLLQVAEAEV